MHAKVTVAQSSQESPRRGGDTYSHKQVEGGDFVFFWPHRHGWLKDGAQRQCEGGSVIVECDVLLGEISCPAEVAFHDIRQMWWALLFLCCVCLKSSLPICIRSFLHDLWHGAMVQNLLGIFHVKEPELPVHCRRRGHPVVIRCRSRLNDCFLNPTGTQTVYF